MEEELDNFLDGFYTKYSPNEIPQGERRERLKQKLSSDFDGYVTQMYQKYAPDNIPDAARLQSLRTKYLAPQETAGAGDYAKSLMKSVNRGAYGLASEGLKWWGNLTPRMPGTEGLKEFDPVFTQAGNLIEDTIIEANPRDENVNQTFQDVGEGLGQAAGIVLTSGAGGTPQLAQTATKIPSIAAAARQGLKTISSHATSAPGVVAGMAMSNPEWEAAKQAGLSDDEAFMVMTENYLLGMTEAIPIGNALGRLNQLTGRKALDILKTGGAGAFEEWLQETLQTYLSNKIAEGSYDPERDPMLGVLQAGKVGAIVGAILPSAGVIARSKSPSATKKEAVSLSSEIESVKDEVATSTPSSDAEIDQVTQEIIQSIGEPSVGYTPSSQTQETSTDTSESPQIGQTGSSGDQIQPGGTQEVEPAVREVDRSIEETKGLELTPIEAAERFQGFITGTGEEAISQIADYAEGKFKKRSEFEQFVEAYNERNERKIYDSEANKVWEQIREMKPRIKDTSPKMKITEMGGLKKQIKDFARGIREGRKDAKTATKELTTQITEKLGKSDVSPTVVSRIIKRIGNVNLLNPLKVQELIRYTDRVAQDATYAEKLDRASELQSRIKKASKNPVFASFKPSLQKMGRLNLNNLEKIQSIDDYIEKAEGYLGVTKDVKSPKYSPTDLKAFAEYADNAFVESKLVGDELAREALGMEGDLTKEELEYLFSEDDEFYENALDTERKILDDKLRNIASYSKMGLEDVDIDDQVVDTIKKIDLNDLTGSQLKNYIKVVDNIVMNGDLSNAGGLEVLGKAIEGAKELQQDKTIARNLNVVEQGAYNLPNIMKAMFGLTTKAAKVRQTIGLNDFIAGTSRAKNSKDRLLDTFTEFKKKLDRKYGKDVLSRENITTAGIASYLHGYDQGTDPQAAFEQSKRNMEESIEREKAADPSHGEFIESQYNRFKDARTIEEVKALIPKDVAEIMGFFQKTFEDVKLLQDRANRVYDNRYAPIVEDYFPRAYLRSGAERVDIDDISDKFDSIKIFNPSTAFSRTNRLPANSVVNLSFVDVMVRKYQDTLMDVYANPGVSQMKEFFKLPQAVDVFNSQENLNKFKNSIKFAVNKEYGTNGYKETDLSSAIDKVSTYLKNAAYLRALGSPTQYLKQATVLFNTVVRLGNPTYLLDVPKNAPIYQLYSIGQRGKRLGGLYVEDVIENKYKIEAANKASKIFGPLYRGLEEGVWSRISAPLRDTDVMSAKKSWGAFFKKYMKENHQIDVDLTTAHENLQDPRYQMAASYAEQMVGETQIQSSTGEASQFLSPNTVGGKAFISIFFPFATYAFNTKSRLINISKYLATGNKQERMEAASAMGGLLAEVAAFNAVAYTLAITLAPALDSVWREMFGFDEPEEDEDNTFRQQIIMSNLFRDLFPLAIQQNINDEILKNINEISANSLREEGYTEEEIRNRVPFFVRSKTTGVMDGSLYAIPFQSFSGGTAFDVNFQDDVFKMDTPNGPKEIPIDNNLQDFVVFSTLMEILSIAGIGISDVNNSIERVKKEQIREARKLNQEQ